MTRSHLPLVSVLISLNLLGIDNVAAADTSKKRGLRKKAAAHNNIKKNKKELDPENKLDEDIIDDARRMLDPIDLDEYDWDSRVKIPVGKAEDSHEEGRMLFNLDIVDIADPINGPATGKNSKVGGHHRETNIIDGIPDESEVEAYIVNGYSSDQEPWFALTMEKINGDFYRGPCGATMVSKQWAITAAHCISNMRQNDLKSRLDYLYVGAYKPWTADSDGNGNDGRPYEIIKIVQWIEHYQHSPGAGSDHDIALLKLATPVSDSFSSFYPMGLPSSGSGFSSSDTGYVYGFGDTSFGGGNSNYLRKTSVKYVEHGQCKSAMSKWGITDDMICFGGDGKSDACSGDSGGPVICKGALAGVVSWGYRCNVRGYPGVYASTEEHLDWIMQSSQYEISGRLASGPDPSPIPAPSAPVPSPTSQPPTLSPPTAAVSTSGCVDFQGTVYYFLGSSQKSHTCSEIAAKNSSKRSEICNRPQRSGDFNIGTKVKVSCKVTCNVC